MSCLHYCILIHFVHQNTFQILNTRIDLQWISYVPSMKFPWILNIIIYIHYIYIRLKAGMYWAFGRRSFLRLFFGALSCDSKSVFLLFLAIYEILEFQVIVTLWVFHYCILRHSMPRQCCIFLKECPTMLGMHHVVQSMEPIYIYIYYKYIYIYILLFD